MTKQQYLPEDEVYYLAPQVGLSPKILKSIQRGEYGVEGKIDLHGETIDSAREQLFNSLYEAYEEERRCLLVIHGKGHSATLKNQVIHWLKEMPKVLFFCSAQPKEGGTGALYVLLRKNRSFLQEDIQNKKEDLSKIRKKIDQLDQAIIQLICQRLLYARKAAEVKGTDLPDEARERQILVHVAKKAKALGYPPEYLENIYQSILTEMKKYQYTFHKK